MSPPPLFFVHVMKTAGTAVLRLTREQYPADRCSPDPSSDVAMPVQKQSVDYFVDNGTSVAAMYSLISAHVPAWVATDTTPDHQRVTLLRDPVERTISQLRQTARLNGYETLDAIFDEERWRSRLSNYMTRVFGLRADEHHATRAATAGLRPDDFNEADRAEFVSEMEAVMGLAMENARPMTRQDLERSIEMLDRCAIVGTMENFDGFLEDLSDLIGARRPTSRKINAATDELEASPALRRRIEEEMALDMELYERVLTSGGR